MNKLICAMLSGLISAGCATQRPPMPDEKYADFSRGWAALHHCSMDGMIDADAAARGRTYMVSTMNTYSFDGKRLDAEAYRAIQAGNKPSVQDCRSLNISIQGRKQQIENQNAQAAIQQQEAQNMLRATKPTQTYCNKIGTQVLCNSF